MNQTPCRLILNGATEAVDQIRERLARLLAGDPCDLLVTESHDDIGRFARDARRDGVRRLIVAGGDGTVHHVVNALAPDFDDLEIGVVPLGTGNDLARSLGIPLDDLQRAVAIARRGTARPIDLIRVLDDDVSYLVNAASGGFGGKVAADVAQADKSTWGAFAYWMTALSELVDMQPFEVQLDLDGELETARVYGVFVVNGQFVGGGFPIAPDAQLNDGRLNVAIVPVLAAVDLLSAGLNYMLGSRPSDVHAAVSCRPAQRLRLTTSPEMLFSIDGEPVCRIDATFEVVPHAIRFAAAPLAPAIGGEPASEQECRV